MITEKLTQAAKNTNGERLIRNTPDLNKKDKDHTDGKNNNEWFDVKCKESRNTYHRYRKEHAQIKTSESFRKLQLSSRHYKKTMNSAIKKYKFNEQKKLKQLRQKDSKQFWKRLKKKSKTESQPINKLFNFFKDFNENKGETTENIAKHVISDDDCLTLNGKIKDNEILQAIGKVKNEKSPGIDFVLNEYIKASANIFIPIYRELFNLLLDTGVFPSEWSIGMISPIYKNKGDNKEPANYRPITLLSCLGKVFTSILNSRLTTFIEENNILYENQAGFRTDYATTDHILTLHLLLEYMKFNKNTLYCGFMDLSKAYDTINKAKLFQKLEMFNVKGKFFNVVLSMYTHTKSLLRCNNLYTNTFLCNIGIRQGENLSSMLFAIFMNDIEMFFNEKNCDYIPLLDHTKMHVYLQLFILLYADDTVLLATSVKQFRKILSEYGNYCKLWNIDININKSKLMIFGRHRKENKYYINDIEIEVVKEYRYLGITFTKNKRFVQTIKENAAKGKRAMYAIITKARTEGLSISCQIHLFKVIVLPILLYGCEVWGFEDLEIIEKVQIDFCRNILKLNKSTQRNLLLSETGLLPVRILVKCRIVKYWIKIMTGKETKYVRQVVACLHDFYENTEHESKWLHFVYNSLTENGMYNVILNPYMYIHKEFTRRLEDQFHQELNQQISNSNRTQFYRAIKETFGYDDILDEIDPHLVYYLLKFKTNNHRLPVETGRWNQTPHNERICTHCSKDVGDEFHYIFNCPLFLESRKKYIKTYFYRHPNMLKAGELFQSKNPKVITKLCLFIKIIINSFKQNKQ